jgi:hypothetical protein
MDLALPLPLSPCFRMHPDPLGLPVLGRRSPRHPVARGMLPSVSRATVTPCTPVSLPQCTSDYA